VLVRRRAEQRLAAAAAEQEDEPFQVLEQPANGMGGVASELFQAGAETGGVARQPLAEELQHFGEFGGVGSVELYLGAWVHRLRGWVA
jgi:hypothetical protein